MRGFTVLELTVVLAILAVSLAVSLPAARRQRDRAAVASAREALVSWVARARREALLAGGATLEVRSDGRVWIEAGEAGPDTLSLTDRFGVRGEMSRSEVSLGFDGLGIGRLASRTFTLRRGDRTSGLSVSSYGRVRRW